MARLSMEHLGKVYANGVEALRDFSLEVAEGEFVVLVGPSGCGKTTALRMVAGLEEITSGTLRIGDRVVNDVSPLERDVAMVFQNYALYPHLSVADNIGFPLEMRNVPKAERTEKVREVGRILGLEDMLTRKPRHLSGGQRQRVAMGRAIVRRPSVFLMDEPLSNLDAKLRVQMRAEVLRVQRRLSVATLYVTHDQTEAMTMGDRVVVMNGGVLQQSGSPQELYDRPANVFVASFIGSPAMNFYEATIHSAGTSLEMRIGNQTVSLSADIIKRLPNLGSKRDQPLIVGIRPEHLTLPASGSPAQVPERSGLSADVAFVETLGNELFVHFELSVPQVSGRERGSAQADKIASDDGRAVGVARVSPRATVQARERVTFALDTERVHFFDPETGEAVGRPVVQAQSGSPAGISGDAKVPA